jgi:hypothetical protein
MKEIQNAIRKLRARAILLGITAALSLLSLVAAAADTYVEHVYHVSCNGSSQTLVAENVFRSGMSILAVTTAGVADTNAVVFTVSTSAHVAQTARNGASLNGWAIPGGASWTWPDSTSPTQKNYKGAVTVKCTSPDGVQLREW